MNYPEPIAKLIESYMKLPGIGQKTATRLAFYTIDMKEEDANAFAKALISVKRDSISVVFAEILLKKILVKFAKIKIVTVVLF